MSDPAAQWPARNVLRSIHEGARDMARGRTLVDRRVSTGIALQGHFFHDIRAERTLVEGQSDALPIEAPPSTCSVCPVMKAASSDNRKPMAAAISCGVPNRPIGTPDR